MYRLHRLMLKRGLWSRVLCQMEPPEDDPTVDLIPQWRKLDRVVRRLTSPLGFHDLHRISSFRIASHPFFREANIIHFHGSHSGFLSYLALPDLTRTRPAVWTLHDNWAMTGRCAAVASCERWTIGCGSCPQLDAHPATRRDRSRVEWHLKRWAFKRSDIHFVAISSRQRKDFARSMLAGHRCDLIKNGIDTEIFKPRDGRSYRRELGISPDHIVLVFCALDVRNPRKGGELLAQALEALAPELRQKLHVLLVGGRGEALRERLVRRKAAFGVTWIGQVRDPAALARAYSAGDMFVSPTRAEPFGLVVAESMGCATAPVAFAVGGILDIIEHERTGLLVEPESVAGLTSAIERLIRDETLLSSLKAAGRARAVDLFSDTAMADRYTDLYSRVLGRTTKPPFDAMCAPAY